MCRMHVNYVVCSLGNFPKRAGSIINEYINVLVLYLWENIFIIYNVLKSIFILSLS